MKCGHCEGNCKKAGVQRNGTQKYRCNGCGKYQQAEYKNKACEVGTDGQVVAHVKEGCGIWNNARLLGIAKGTVLTRIKRIALAIKPVVTVKEDCSYEVDEMHTFVGSKEKECYMRYAEKRSKLWTSSLDRAPSRTWSA